MTAMSPRNPPPKLRSTSAENGETPRKEQSLYQEISLRRGFPVRAGKGRRNRLQSYRGVELRPDPTVTDTTDKPEKEEVEDA